MNSDTPYTAHGDEALEARIVSWVLGEASAFEAAELERLCEERPELRVFHRRMLALHGLLTEAGTTKPDDAWKLPAGKRKAIEELIGQGERAAAEAQKEHRVRHSGRRALFAIAACLILTAVVAGLLAPMAVRHRVIRETPVIANYSADLPKKEERQQKSDADELGSQELSMREVSETVQAKRAPFPSSRPTPATAPPERGALLEEAKSLAAAPEAAAKPSSPTTSSSRARLAGTLSPAAAPVPEVDVDTPTADDGLTLNEAADKNWNVRDESLKDPFVSQSQAAAQVAKAKSDELAALGAKQESPKPSLARGEILAGETGDSPLRPAAPRDSGPAQAGFGEASQSTIVREFQYPTESEPPEIPNSRLASAEELASIKGANGSNAALGDQQSKSVDDVRRGLFIAEGNFNLGNYDEAKRNYEDVLRKDPYSLAARRGIERIETAKSDHFRAGYDVARAELLSQVDESWELTVPADGDARELEGELNTGYSSEYLFRGVDLGKVQKKQAPHPSVALVDEIAAAEEPYSTFSLNVSDASFQIAQAALARGERPEPAGVKVEQFYNAVDYGDPAPAAGEPVAVAIEQAAHPVVPGRNLVRISLKTAAAGRGAAQPLRLTLLADQSGSMARDDRRAAMDKALGGLAGLLTEKDLVTVIGFARTPRLIADGMPGNQAARLADVVNQSASEGGTNLEEAIALGERMAARRKLEGAQNRIVLFTDGAANLGDADPARLAEKVKALRQKGIAFDIAGIAADDLNDDLLGELARNGNGRYYVVGKGGENDFARQLAGAFHPAAENVKIQVRFNPERVGRYKLIGFEKDRLKTEDFRNDAVDAAELAAEEAGVAIYQVEPLPGGKGELGEVSARFRDTASGQMVERTWTISYDTAAPAFDRAKPSMQLAVLSMLAAEKLRGGPLADAIDFKQLTAASANVKQFYGNTGSVAEVLRMLDALK